MLIDNIHLLRKRYPLVRKYFVENEMNLSLAQYEIVDSREGSKTIRFHSKDGKKLLIHSFYNPLQEAERLINSYKDKVKENAHVFFYGIGMGYHVEKFIEMYPNHTYSLYEPIPEVFYHLANHRDLSKLFTEKMRNFYIDEHNQETLTYLEEFTTSNQNILFIVLPSYKNIFPEKLKKFNQNIKDKIVNYRSEIHTDQMFQKLWVINSLMNFETVLNTPNMLRDIDRTIFEGKPAIIVSAGPSLAKDMEHIRYIKENNLAYIFSVGSAINSLVEFDIFPDAVCTYDPGLRNYKVFEKMVERKIEHIPMIFGSSVGFDTIKKYKGPKVHFITSQDRASLYFLEEQLNLLEDIVFDSPSIAVMTFQILLKLGANPIIFAGQNLGYLNGTLYSEGIEYDFVKTKLDKEMLEKLPTTEDVYGNEIKTSMTFNSMRRSLEGYAKLYPDRKLINTTKGGAKIEGIPFQPIEEVIEQVLIDPIEKIEWWKANNSYEKVNFIKKIKKLTISVKEFVDYLDSFEPLMKSIFSHAKFRNESKVLSELTKFDKLYNKFLENEYYQNFLSFYIRTDVKFLDNEIKRLNAETSVLNKGESLVPIFTQFIKTCRKEHEELSKLIFEHINVFNIEN